MFYYTIIRQAVSMEKVQKICTIIQRMEIIPYVYTAVSLYIIRNICENE